MRSLTILVRLIDQRIAAALMVAIPLTACDGRIDSGDGGATEANVRTGCPCLPNCGPQSTQITYTRCAGDAGDAGDAGCFPSCTQVCEAHGLFGGQCSEEGADGGDGVASCPPDCKSGRRPHGLRAERAAPGVGGYLARSAWLEAASVCAFERLAREIEAHGAPRWLVREAERAARDEVRHAKIMGALARARAARVPRVRMRDSARADGIRSLEAIARENAVEGCVGEAYGALVARWQAAHAADAAIHRAMAGIAHDEARHAALSLAIDAWIAPRLSRAAAIRVERARVRAIARLARPSRDLPTRERAAIGLPVSTHASAMARALFEGAAGPSVLSRPA